jgi:hypothetical protein
MAVLSRGKQETQEMRIMKTWPDNDWNTILENLHKALISDREKGECTA